MTEIRQRHREEMEATLKRQAEEREALVKRQDEELEQEASREMTNTGGPIPEHDDTTNLEYLKRALECSPPRTDLVVRDIYHLLCQHEERIQKLEASQAPPDRDEVAHGGQPQGWLYRR